MVSDKRECYICGRTQGLEVHHMLHGIRRAKADKHGLTCYLCRGCHKALHDRGTFDRELEQDAQRAFEALYGHEEFMREFGRNYL